MTDQLCAPVLVLQLTAAGIAALGGLVALVLRQLRRRSDL